MKTTKKQIRKNTRTTKVVGSMNLGQMFDHWYQHDEYHSFELHHSSSVVIRHFGPNSYEIGGATTKEKFIEVVHAYLNL